MCCASESHEQLPGASGQQRRRSIRRARRVGCEYHAIGGVAVDRFTPARGRLQFGNMIFTRLPVLQVLRHQLPPWPAEPTLPTMPRLALEVVLDAPGGALRVTTTHLEFYSALQRMAQVRMLQNIHADAESHAADEFQRHKIGSPFETLPRGTRNPRRRLQLFARRRCDQTSANGVRQWRARIRRCVAARAPAHAAREHG